MSAPRESAPARAPGRGLAARLRGRAGPSAALGILYDRYGSTALAVCFRILRDRAEAEEVLEEVFWELWARRDRYDAARSTPSGSG